MKYEQLDQVLKEMLEVSNDVNSDCMLTNLQVKEYVERIVAAHDSELMLAIGGYYTTEQYEAMREVFKLIDSEQLDLADSKLIEIEKELGSFHPELTRAKTLIHFLREGSY